MFIEITDCAFYNQKTLINTRYIQRIVPYVDDSKCQVFLVDEVVIDTRMTYEELKELIEKS